MSEQGASGKNQGNGNQGEETAKVLPFRRQPTIQPNFRRRAAAQAELHKKKSKNSLKSALWKSRLAKGFQLVLLLTGALLALKNCGKF
jgi:hypothetical protein